MATKITKFDDASLKLVQTAIRLALEGIGEEFGLKMGNRTMRYDPHLGSFSMTVTGEMPDQKAAAQAEALIEYAKVYGMDTEAVCNGYRLIGFDITKGAKPWMLEKGGNRGYRAGTDWLEKAGFLTKPLPKLTEVDNLLEVAPPTGLSL